MRLRKKIQTFITIETLSSLFLLFSVVLALCVSNSELYDEYQKLVKLPIAITVGEYSLNKPLIKWVNDGLMALFFLLLTLETKFHCLEGEYNSRSAFILPLVAAVGGAVIPPLIYYFFNNYNMDYVKGWAIPIATDTAFVLGALSFFSRRLTLSSRLFVVALSIVDDIIAVLILALFYTSEIHTLPLLLAIICILVLFILHAYKVSNLTWYFIIGSVLWLLFVEAGIHGTIAGVFLGLFVPVRAKRGEDSIYSPLKVLEKFLHPLVALFVLPLFGFLNSEVSFKEIGTQDLFSSVSLGIFVALFLGKQLGIMTFSYLGIRLNLCKLPHNLSWYTYYCLSVLCGIGFTFSLFIGLLSFDEVQHINQMKLGVILGSFASAVMGICLLIRLPHSKEPPALEKTGEEGR